MLLPTAVTPRVGIPTRRPRSTSRVRFCTDCVSNSPPMNTCTATAATLRRAASSTSTASCSFDSSFRMLGPPLARSTTPFVNVGGTVVRRMPRVHISAVAYGISGRMFTSTRSRPAVDVNILPLLPYATALMCTRGILRTTVPPTFTNGVVMRASGGPSILKELSDEQLAIDIEDATRLNVAALAVQIFIGGEHETQSVHNMTRLVDFGLRYGIPVMGVTAVGKQLTRDAKYLRLACRIIAELGAQFVKTYHCDEGFDTVIASCPVPVVMAGGKKLPELDALTMAYRAVTEGAAGVDMGRNIFQSEAPVAMIQAVGAVVHQLLKPEQAYDLYQTLRRDEQRGRRVAV